MGQESESEARIGRVLARAWNNFRSLHDPRPDGWVVADLGWSDGSGDRAVQVGVYRHRDGSATVRLLEFTGYSKQRHAMDEALAEVASQLEEW